jgi:hypothetical protein
MPPVAWRRIARIWGSLYLVIFIQNLLVHLAEKILLMQPLTFGGDYRIIHVIRGGLMWRPAPAAYGPHKTLYNRFVRWSRAGVFDRIFTALAAESAATDTVMIDATHLKAHRTSASLRKKGLFPAASDGPKAA